MTVEELNELVDSGGIDEFIRVCEAKQCKALSRIADDISARENVRLVLIAGASSAGKTTTSKRLCTQLRVNGSDSLLLSTDDYFVGDRRNPRDENGELDYETVECVDMPRLAEDVNRLFAGESVRLRRFDFIGHEGYDAAEAVKLPRNAKIVIEGIHALNPILTKDIDDGLKYRVFIDPVTQPEIFAKFALPSTDARFLRRLVRDNQFRKLDPLETLKLWPKVLAGEKKWIYPFSGGADARFDSSLAYELAVIRHYVVGLLVKILREDPGNVWINSLATLLEHVRPASAVAVPGDSILRETIGGSQLEY